MAALATFIALLALWPFAIMWKAYVLLIMWGWFLQPYTGIGAPSIYVTAGALMMLSLATFRPDETTKTKEPSEHIANAISYGFLLPLFALGTAWVWKWLQWGLA